MNTDQLQSLIRTILIAVGGFAVERGWVDSATATTIAGALAIVIAAGWGLVFHAGPKKADAVAVATGTATSAQRAAVVKST